MLGFGVFWLGVPARQGLEHEVGERFVDAARGGDGFAEWGAVCQLSWGSWGAPRGSGGEVKLPRATGWLWVLWGSALQCGIAACSPSVRAAHGCEREIGKILFWPRCARFLHPFLQPSPGPFPFFHARCCRSTSSGSLLLCASVPAEAAAVQGTGPAPRSLPGPLGTYGGRAQTPLLRAIKGTVGCSFFLGGEPCAFSPRRSYSGEQRATHISCGISASNLGSVLSE